MLKNKAYELAWLLSTKRQIDDSVKSIVDDLMLQYFDKSSMYIVDQNINICEPEN